MFKNLPGNEGPCLGRLTVVDPGKDPEDKDNFIAMVCLDVWWHFVLEEAGPVLKLIEINWSKGTWDRGSGDRM